MATTYFPAPDSVALMVNARMQSHHEDMHSIGVRVGILFAQNDKGPAVKLGGAACNATIRVVSHIDRVTKRYDAEMVIDEKNWEGFTHRQRLALIAHELKHLMLVRKKDPDSKTFKIQIDAGGRPKLKLRPGDWDVGDGFADIVSEFGFDAIEYHNIDTAFRLAEYAREQGPPKPPASLLDAVEAKGGYITLPPGSLGIGLPNDVTVSMKLAERFKQGGTNGAETVARTRSGVDEAPDGGEVEHNDDSGVTHSERPEPADDYGFGPSNPRFERVEGPSYDERTRGI